MKKKLSIILLAAIIIFFTFYVYSGYQEKTSLETDTIAYLENKGYEIETEIEELVTVNVGQEENLYAAVVTFKDEPMVNYFYMYKENSKDIQQIDIVNQGSNHSFKHAE